jgi:hypothetical protein
MCIVGTIRRPKMKGNAPGMANAIIDQTYLIVGITAQLSSEFKIWFGENRSGETVRETN